ncbi:MAG TPA: hypothetical protein VGF45_01385 [Polyangia bacterium]
MKEKTMSEKAVSEKETFEEVSLEELSEVVGGVPLPGIDARRGMLPPRNTTPGFGPGLRPNANGPGPVPGSNRRDFPR